MLVCHSFIALYAIRDIKAVDKLAMFYVSEDLFLWIKNIERDCFDKTIYNVNAMIMLKESLRSVTMDLVAQHPSMKKFKTEIIEALVLSNELDEIFTVGEFEFESCADEIVEKFIDYYTNLSMNDSINYKCCQLQQSYGNSSANVTFRLGVQTGAMASVMRKKLADYMAENQKLKAKEKERKEKESNTKKKAKAIKLQEKEKRNAEIQSAKLAKAKLKETIPKRKTGENGFENIDLGGHVQCDSCDQWFLYPAEYGNTIPSGDIPWYCSEAMWDPLRVAECPAQAHLDSNDVSVNEEDEDEDDDNDEDEESKKEMNDMIE